MPAGVPEQYYLAKDYQGSMGHGVIAPGTEPQAQVKVKLLRSVARNAHVDRKSDPGLASLVPGLSLHCLLLLTFLVLLMTF